MTLLQRNAARIDWPVVEAALELVSAMYPQQKLWLPAGQYMLVPENVRGYWERAIVVSPVNPCERGIWQLETLPTEYVFRQTDARESWQFAFAKKATLLAHLRFARAVMRESHSVQSQ